MIRAENASGYPFVFIDVRRYVSHTQSQKNKTTKKEEGELACIQKIK